MTERRKFKTAAPWEEIVGYSRAVRADRVIEVSGTIAMDEQGHSVGPGDPYAQTVAIIRMVKRVLEDAGSSLDEVIRTRIYVTDISRWEEVGRAHGHFFKEIRPATSMVQVAALIRPESLVEIEFTAMTGD